MSDEIVTPPASVAPAPVAAPAPAEAPSFRFEKPAAPISTTPPAETKPTGTEPDASAKPADDKAAAIKAAARASKAERDAKKALAASEAKLKEAEAKGADTSALEKRVADAEARWQAVATDPTHLFEHGWDPDKLIGKILMPKAGPAPADPRLDVIEAKLAADEAAKEAETKAAADAKKEAEHKAAADQLAAATTQAHAEIVKTIAANADTCFLVDAEDAPAILDAVEAYCVAENWAPTFEESKDLVAQAAKQIHAAREKRFGARLSKPAAAPLPGVSEGPSFRSSKQQHRPQAQPTPSTSITNSQGPLPTAAPKYVPSFR